MVPIQASAELDRDPGSGDAGRDMTDVVEARLVGVVKKAVS